MVGGFRSFEDLISRFSKVRVFEIHLIGLFHLSHQEGGGRGEKKTVELNVF
jgi:hypothetical protein